MKTRLLLIALLIFAVARLSASTIIDSLKSLLTHQGGIELVQTINELSWHYKNIDVDSALLYARQGLRFGAAFNSQQAIALSLNSMGNAFEAKGLVDSALYYHNQCLIIKRSYSDTLGIANSLNNIGILYDEMGDYSRSLAHYFEALGYFEELGDLGSQAMTFGNIG
ncbi:MAG: tetratricopeptide (TPR) repeat protein, partial [Cyclobacteriaceae bacterium]